MQELAPDVYLLPGFPPYTINAYLVGGVLIDSHTRYDAPLLLHALRGQRVLAHALTHGHPDHQGSSHAVCSALHLPLWCGAGDAAAVERGDIEALLPRRPFNSLMHRLFSGPSYPITRRLREGDRLGDLVVIETPGHSPGHISFWRESDGVLILGDVLSHQHPLTQQIKLCEPLRIFTCDPAMNRAAARKIAALRPRLVCFGHGPPLRNPDALAAFVARLPD
ncbi:MAG: MBL fold metallo-hydrolase [Chloroflexaceae bacterium]|jgi:glyoxylase-like metal-dependent hydrolase (beta-lactamase superfamily II)|nr:MBL fold metallo-hydrolase [Chloroflexaceae bacterium]